MFMLGTNDVTRGNTATQITAAYTKIVQTVRANNPKAKFIVSIPMILFWRQYSTFRPLSLTGFSHRIG